MSRALMQLRPVAFHYKREYDKGERTLQFGLIAEEVAKVFPELVAYNPDGTPYTVRYQYLSSILLGEVQKQYRYAEAQEQRIKELERRLARIEMTLAGERRIGRWHGGRQSLTSSEGCSIFGSIALSV